MSNYRLWCDVSGVMNIHPDNICVFAVNNAVEDEVQRADDVDGQQDWKLAYIYKDLTTKAKKSAILVSFFMVGEGGGQHSFSTKILPGCHVRERHI